MRLHHTLLEQMAPSLLPSVHAGMARVDMAHLAWCTERESALVQHAVDKRKSEFATGRKLSKELLEAHAGLNDVELLCSDRKPMWPKDWTGSITHSHGFCAVCIGNHRVECLGVDLEMKKTLEPRVVEAILTVTERQKWLPRWNPVVMFSLKEAFYKSLSQKKIPVFGFHDAEISAMEEGKANIMLKKEQGELPEGYTLHGHWVEDEHFVLSAFVKLWEHA